VVVALGELDLQLDAREERRVRVEDKAVRPRREIVGETCSTLDVGLGAPHRGAVREQLDRDALRGFAGGGVEHVGRK